MSGSGCSKDDITLGTAAVCAIVSTGVTGLVSGGLCTTAPWVAFAIGGTVGTAVGNWLGGGQNPQTQMMTETTPLLRAREAHQHQQEALEAAPTATTPLL